MSLDIEQDDDTVRWSRRFALYFVFIVLTTALFFLFGSILGLAVPGGWEAWRIGALLGAIAAIVVIFVGAITLAILALVESADD